MLCFVSFYKAKFILNFYKIIFLVIQQQTKYNYSFYILVLKLRLLIHELKY